MFKLNYLGGNSLVVLNVVKIAAMNYNIEVFKTRTR